MKEITQFANVAGTPSGLTNQLDADGSSIDIAFAEAIIANEPTSVLEEHGIIRVKKIPPEVDKASFPIVRNTQLTWVEIGRTTSGSLNELGSDLDATGLNRVEYKEVQPTIWTANFFLPDTVNLLNKTNFEMFAKLGATDAKRRKEEAALGSYLGSETKVTQIYAAGGFVSAGSIIAGSTLDPLDLTKAKHQLMTGSDPWRPDYALMHPDQYVALQTHADFSPGATATAASRKARFTPDGELVRYDGLDIVVTELMPAVTGSATTAWTVDGHPVIVGQKGYAICRAEHFGLKIHTEDSRRRHGQWKIFDISYAHDILVPESVILLRAAD